MTNPPFQNFGGSPPAYQEPDRVKRYGALICGILQLCISWMMIAVGIIKDAALFPAFGVHAFLGAFFSIFAGAFGVQYSRTGGKCPTITSMVFSILATLVMFSGLITNSILVAVSEAHVDNAIRELQNGRVVSPEDEGSLELARLAIQHVFAGAAEASYALMVFCCLVNFIVSIVQSAFACGIVCSCCQPTNTNTYLANPNPNPYPQTGFQGEQQPQSGYDVNMGHIATNA